MPDPDGQITSRDLASGAITSRTFDTDIQSDNFIEGSAGWRIRRDTGDVEFNDAVFRGEIRASTITGGLIRSSETGERVEINDVFKEAVRWYSGDAEEAEFGQARGTISVVGSGGSRFIRWSLIGARFGGASNHGYISMMADSESQDGSTTFPLLTITALNDDAQVTVTSNLAWQFFGGLTLPVLAADPTSPGNVPQEGQVYVNTSANDLRVYEGGSWRTIAAW